MHRAGIEPATQCSGLGVLEWCRVCISPGRVVSSGVWLATLNYTIHAASFAKFCRAVFICIDRPFQSLFERLVKTG